ncbi:MAG: hypothetical protein U1G08_15050 [Verrucomicrobiota bacterium]
MPDWYDRLLTGLGLDSIRNDRLLGVPLREFPPLAFSNGHGELSPTLCQLPDGRTQIVFKTVSAGDHWIGFFPCTPGNRDCLQRFLQQSGDVGTDPVPDAHPPGFWPRFLGLFRPSRMLVAMDPLPDRHLGSTVEWALVVGHDSRPRLQFTIRAPRRLFRRQLNWTPEVAASLLEFAKAVGQNECDWSHSRKTGS